MNRISPKNIRALAVAPSTRGFGFAIVEGTEVLIDWGVKVVKGDKNGQSLAKVKYLITHYQPERIILQDLLAKDSRRAARIRALSKQIMEIARTLRLKVTLISVTQINQMFFGNKDGTKQARAEIIARRFPEELGF